jgi:hypothetical protein
VTWEVERDGKRAIELNELLCRETSDDLILENVFCFAIQLVSQFIDASDLVRNDRVGRLVQKTPDGLGYEGGSVIRNVVDLFCQFIGKSDLHAHGSNGKP